jgi:hypothetical protein
VLRQRWEVGDQRRYNLAVIVAECRAVHPGDGIRIVSTLLSDLGRTHPSTRWSP